MPEDVASNEGLGHVAVAGVKAMQHFSGQAWRVARIGLAEDKRGRWRQDKAWACQSGAAVELDDGTNVEAPSCAPSAPAGAGPEQCAFGVRARDLTRMVATSHNGAAPRAGEYRFEQCVQMQARAATRSGRPAAK